MASRNRIIYASQSVIVNGDFLHRVQTLGSTTTFNSTDLFELGQQDVIDVVDDVPTVAITLDTNDWGTCRTAAALASVDFTNFSVTAGAGNGTLTAVSGTTNISYYHGVGLSYYGISGAEFDLWAPVQAESALGTANDLIDQTLFMSRCFVTGITANYTVGGEATENYTAEADNKTWFLNDGRFVSQEDWVLAGGETQVDLGLLDGTNSVQTLSDNSLAFLHINPIDGKHSVKLTLALDGSNNYYEVVVGAATATQAGYTAATNVLLLPTGITAIAAGDVLCVRYSADAYADTSGDSTTQKANYFTAATDANTEGDHSNVGGLRQGQIEIYLLDPDVLTPGDPYELALRLQTVSLSATLDREALSELGHLKPYDRPLNFPVEITTTVETTAGDLETFAKFAGKEAEYDAGTLLDLTIDHLLSKDNLILAVQIYNQTDVEAGGNGADRKVLTTDLEGRDYQVGGAVSTYTAVNVSNPEREYPIKTVIVPGLKATTEAYSLDQGANATQTYGFKSTNKFFLVKGHVPLADLLVSPGLQKV
jgi:hypothetical protein